jgi:hypothetical protein
MTAVQASIQIEIPFLELLLPDRLEKQKAARLMDCSPNTLNRNYLNREFYEEIGEDYEAVKTSKKLSKKATAHFFKKYPEKVKYFLLKYIERNYDKPYLVQLALSSNLNG